MTLKVQHCSTSINQQSILKDISFEINSNEIVAVIGPSGSGKTTLLRCVAGLQPYSGSICIDQQAIDALPTEQRNIGLLDQHLNLFPHLSVFDNIAYPLKIRMKIRMKIRKQSKAHIQTTVQKILTTFGIEHLTERLPQDISGGEQQRVALARTMIYEPQLVLLDEPFGGLDAILRYELIIWLQTMLQQHPVPTIFVTHDVREAHRLCQRAIVIVDGQLVAFDTWTRLEAHTHPVVKELLTKHL